MPNMRIHTEDLTSPIKSLEEYFRKGGVSIIQAAFEHSYFVDPEAVRAKTPYYPDRARRSGIYYPKKTKGQHTIWYGDGRQVILDVNLRHTWLGNDIQGASWRIALPTEYGTFGDIPGTPMRSPPDGTFAICRFGPVCSPKISTRTRNCSKRSVRLRGNSTSATIQFATHPTSLRTRGWTWRAYSGNNHC